TVVVAPASACHRVGPRAHPAALAADRAALPQVRVLLAVSAAVVLEQNAAHVLLVSHLGLRVRGFDQPGAGVPVVPFADGPPPLRRAGRRPPRSRRRRACRARVASSRARAVPDSARSRPAAARPDAGSPRSSTAPPAPA